MTVQINIGDKNQLITKLRSVEESMFRLNKRTFPTKGHSMLKQMSTLLLESRSILTPKNKGRLPITVKTLRNDIDFCSNSITSSLDAFESSELTFYHVMGLKDQLISKLGTLLSSLEEFVPSKPTVPKEQSKSTTDILPWDDGLKIALDRARSEMQTVSSEPSLLESDHKGLRSKKQAKSVLEMNSYLKYVLPLKNSRKKFVLLSLPVVPVFNNYVDREKISQAGFEFSVIETYLVIKNQTVLAINQSYIRKRGMLVKDYVTHITPTLKKKLGFAFVVFNKASMYKGTGHTYVWLIRENQYNAILGHNQSIKICDWGLGI